MTFISKTQHADVVLIGGGIMSATLGAFLKQLEPNWTISLFERLDGRAGELRPLEQRGHRARRTLRAQLHPAAGRLGGSAKAVDINEQFQVSRQFWSHLVTNGMICPPRSSSTPCRT